MLEINCSFGGGQVIRTALALSTITGIPFQATNIRKDRPKPGLKPQHLTCIEALKQICEPEIKGNELGSMDLAYYPNKLKLQNLNIDIGTAGSITLVMQSLLLPFIVGHKRAKIKITGGTCGFGQMPIEYFKEVLIPHLEKYTKFLKISLLKRGYFPKGQGAVEFTIDPKFRIKNYDDFDDFFLAEKERTKINLINQGHLIQIKGIAHASNDLEKARVVERMAKNAKLILKSMNCPVHIQQEYQETASTGTGITLYSVHSMDKNDINFINPIKLGADVLGKKGKKAEKVGEECARELMRIIKTKVPVDKHLADNLIPFLAVFGGQIKVEEITNHTKANIKVCEMFLKKKFEIKNNIISC